MKPYIIRVKGDIVANDLIHYAQDWVCYTSGCQVPIDAPYLYDSETHSVNGNLILDAHRRAVPYAIYVAEKGISCLSTGDVCAYPGYGAAYSYYTYHMTQVKQQLQIEDIHKDLLQPLYRGLFTDVFSILELFLSDLLLCIIYSNAEVYNNALDYYNMKKANNQEITNLEKKMHDFFFTGIIYHRFDLVEKLFKKVAGIKFPDYKDLNILLHTRNNIAHRYSLSNIDRMVVSVIEKNDVLYLIGVTDNFVNSLIKTLKR